MDSLFPPSTPHRTGTLDVGGGHALAWQEYGRADGIPVVYLHGGPGYGCAPYYHRYFNPQAFRIITYDQRGAPKSPPQSGRLIDHNSPGLLVEDNEALRVHLGVDRWHLFGGSWGATLALLYAERYPERTLSLTLRGVFLMRQCELDHYFHGTRAFYPEVHREFVETLPPAERHDLLGSYYRRLLDPDPAVHLPAAAAWTRYENGFSFLDVPPDAERNDPPSKALPFALIEAHFMHEYMPTDGILEGIEPIRDVPTHIVQGRHDCCCPPMSAYDLSRELRRCTLEFTQAGHSGGMPENVKGLVGASERIRVTGSPLKG